MAAGDFTTSDAVIAYLQTSANVNSFDVAEINALITSASQFIVTYCSDNFLSANYVEYRDGVGLYIRNPTYVLVNRPVTAVSAVTVAGQTIQPITLPMTPPLTAGYAFEPTKLILFGVAVPNLPLCVAISYTAGYATAPSDIQQACIELVAQKYLRRTRIGLSSENAAGIGSRTYSAADLQGDTKLALDLRRRVAPVSAFIVPAEGITPPSPPPLPAVYFEAAASDETTPIVTGTSELTFRAPYAFTLTSVRASLSTAGSSQTAVDINMNGTSIFSTVLTIDMGSRTSVGAAVPAVLSTTAIVDNAEFTVDIDAAGTSATGLKIILIGTVP